MPDTFFAPLHTGTPPTYKFFDGRDWKESTSGKTTPILSPITGEVVGTLQVVSHADIDAVMNASRKAQPGWEATAMHERARIMHLAADWLRHFEEYFVSLLVSEGGKLRPDAKNEITRTADIIDYVTNIALGMTGESMESDSFPGFPKGKLAMIERVAHGVVLAIAPFNYPVNLAVTKIVPALLMGNSVVFKPPTQGGISGLHVARVFEKAGLPPYVLSCVTGSGSDIGDYLAGHPSVSMVAFTGSSSVGGRIGKLVGMKPQLSECGGNNPAVVFPDAEVGVTARELIKGAFSYSGQRCTALKYVLATQATLDKIVPVVIQSMTEMVKMGDPRSPETKLVGPVISEDAAKAIEAAISEAVAAGATVAVGGKRTKTYIEPTVLLNVTPAMRIVREEIFGPILSCIAINSMDEAIATINASAYGLQASVFTKDEGAGMAFAKHLNVGTVQINGSPQRGPDHFPFLGVKASGIGVQGAKYSLEAMSRIKSIVINDPL